MVLTRLTVTLGMGIALCSCTALPTSGPSAGAIINEALEEPYTLIKVTQPIISYISNGRNANLRSTFGNSRRVDSARIGIGDSVIVSIWESADGGLFSAQTGSNATIPEQPVSSSGTISIPYAGTIKVAGRSPEEVKSLIERALVSKAIEPQILVRVVKNVANTVTVTGEVASSGQIPLTARGESLLDVIALAGGPRTEAHQLSVQIARNGRIQSVPLEQLMNDPSENIFVRPGDLITLTRQPRSFTMFGAVTSNAAFQFDEPRLYLNQALAKTGGLNDERANARGIFIYRTEPAELVRSLVPGKPIVTNGRTTNVIYQIDLTDPNGFFLLKNFEIYDKDLVYVANSSLAEIRKFTTLINTTTSPFIQAAVTTRALSK
ncbi:polysaccharide export protein [Rhizobium sp. CFBP 8762]|uniref:polysaccharide biosynthesis/export family protein n=1 Tax=Rhizobium sp. CFBP 8762 TaxID=2775279 RepID=UPI001783FE71|nr:polysaccharide biosynthesis/export family protein [Rhizobium sp. CFBP 8762]MBD8554478.1 polysaccharide export protein [Rhizobium sp. CFBP 8762]